GKFGGGAAEHGRQLGAVVFDDTAGDEAVVVGEQVDDIAAVEAAADADDARGEQGAAAHGDGLDGAVVEDERTAAVGGVPDPELAGRQPGGAGGEGGADGALGQRGARLFRGGQQDRNT